MRILVLVHEFPPIGGGGGNVANDICRGLDRQGHEIVILTAHYDGLPRQEWVDGVRVIRLPSLRRKAYQADFRAMLTYVIFGLWKALRLVRRWKPDIIHVHFAVPAGALAWVLHRFTGIPYLLTVHLGDVPGGVPDKTDQWFRWIDPLTSPIWQDASQVVAVSEYTRQLAIKHYPVDVSVVHNGIDLLALDPGDIQVNNPPVVVFAARFTKQKNPIQLVRVMASLKDLPWQFIMMGDGPLSAEIKEEIYRHGMEDRFNLTGWVTPQEVIEKFRRADILFMPSLSEGLPVIGVQALAMGLAVVAGRVGGFIDLVQQGYNGYLIDPHDAEKMQAALREILSDRKCLHQMRLNSRRLAREFDITTIVEQYANLLDNIVNSHRSSLDNSIDLSN
jgi:glycosyltransferase involved in cell wall biosynthesis